jgi:hypothetical protein
MVRSRRGLFGTVHCLILLTCLAACGYSSPTLPSVQPQAPNVISLDPQDWYILYSAGMPPHPSAYNRGWSFEFPRDGGHVNYVQTPFSATTTPHSVSITFRVESDAPEYKVADPTDSLPATFRLFFEQQHDDLRNPNGRWWAPGSKQNLGSIDNSTLTIVVALTYDQWTNVYGQQDAQAFSAALENIGWVGVTFGGQDFAGHGVGLVSGSAEFILVDYHVD